MSTDEDYLITRKWTCTPGGDYWKDPQRAPDMEYGMSLDVALEIQRDRDDYAARLVAAARREVDIEWTRAMRRLALGLMADDQDVAMQILGAMPRDVREPK